MIWDPLGAGKRRKHITAIKKLLNIRKCTTKVHTRRYQYDAYLCGWSAILSIFRYIEHMSTDNPTACLHDEISLLPGITFDATDELDQRRNELELQLYRNFLRNITVHELLEGRLATDNFGAIGEKLKAPLTMQWLRSKVETLSDTPDEKKLLSQIGPMKKDIIIEGRGDSKWAPIEIDFEEVDLTTVCEASIVSSLGVGASAPTINEETIDLTTAKELRFEDVDEDAVLKTESKKSSNKAPTALKKVSKKSSNKASTVTTFDHFASKLSSSVDASRLLKMDAARLRARARDLRERLEMSAKEKRSYSVPRAGSARKYLDALAHICAGSIHEIHRVVCTFTWCDTIKFTITWCTAQSDHTITLCTT